MTRPHFVYRAYDSAGRLLYVGCTRYPERRPKEHLERSEWARYMDAVTMEGPYSRTDGFAREAAVIEAERPAFNASAAEHADLAANRRAARAELGRRLGLGRLARVRDLGADRYDAERERLQVALRDQFPYVTQRDRLDRYLTLAGGAR